MSDYSEKKNNLSTFSSDFILFSLLILAVFTPLLISGPLALYAHNYVEFHSTAFSIASYLAPYLILIPVLGVLFSLAPKLRSITIPVFLWLALALYIQGSFLVWDYGRFDGSIIDWNQHFNHGITDNLVWLVLAIIIFAIRKSVIANASFIASTLISLQVILASVEFLNSKASFFSDKLTKNSIKSLYSFSKERNVLFILLDEFSSRAFYSKLSKTPVLATRWRDFTYYRDTLASFPTTYPSVPAIISGQAIEPTGSMSKYLNEVIPNSLPVVLQKKSFHSDLVTFHPLCKHADVNSCQPLNHAVDNDISKSIKKDLFKLLDLSFFRYSPNLLKEIIYNNNLWFLQNDGLSKLDPNHRYSIEFADLFANQADNNSDRPTFKFLHFLIPHAPYTLNADCSALIGRKPALKNMYLNTADCALSLAEKIIAKVRDLGVYDQTTIFVIADHGTPVVLNNPGFGQLVHRNLHKAYPLLLVKPANYHNSTLEINNQPKSVLDIVPLVNEIENLGLPNPQNNLSKRKYYSYAWQHDNWFSDTLPKISEFEVSGDSWDFKSWKKLNK